MEALLDAEPLENRALQQQLDHSRSTVSRSLDSLIEVGWVTKTPDGYRLTPAGRLIISNFRELLSTVETAQSLEPFLEWFPLSSYDISLAALSDSEVTVARRGDPLDPIRAGRQLIQSTSEFRGLFQSIDIGCLQLVRKRTRTGEFEGEYVVSAAVAETLSQEPFAPVVSELLASGRHTIHVVEEMPLYVGIADDTTVQIGVEDGEGIPRARLETTNDSVRSWADSLFERHRNEAVDEFSNL